MTTNFLFPPSVPAIYPAVAIEDLQKFNITFNLGSLNDIKNIKHIQIKITKQTNGQSIYNNLDGVIYMSWQDNMVKNSYTQDCEISLDFNKYEIAFSSGELYRIQLRFGSSELWEGDNTNFSNWKSAQITNQAFSDWSSVSIVKAINKPELEVLNYKSSIHKESTETVETLNAPKFIGQVLFTNNSREGQSKYRFKLFQEDKLIEDSGWLSHVGGNDSYVFVYSLENRQRYRVEYLIESTNGYIGSTSQEFYAIQDLLEPIKNIDIIVDDSSEFALENGCFRIILNSNNNLIVGNYVITRTDSHSDYTKWEDVKFLEFFQESLGNREVYVDYTVEYGVGYKYAISAVNALGLRTSNKIDSEKPHFSYFNSCYLFNQKQLPLRFDVQISSFKKTVLAQKQDTLGSKYPVINRNGQSYYAEFPFNGLISMEMDDYITFLDVGQVSHKLATRETDLRPQSPRTPEKTYYMEKVFREQVEKFLNDGTPKLFRSATEGNMIIGLLNVSLSPKQELGRMIYSFSATAYELYDCTLENLQSLNIITIGEYAQQQKEGKEILRAGQLNFYVDNYNLLTEDEQETYISNVNSMVNKNLVNVIREQMTQTVGGTGYTYEVNNIKGLWFEPNYFSDEWIGQPIKLKINNAIIYLGKNQVYYFDEEPSTISLIAPDGYTYRRWNKDNLFNDASEIIPYFYPMINFIVGCQVEETGALAVTSVESKELSGQIIGTFTEDESVIEGIKFDSLRFPEPIPADFNCFDTLDVFAVIEEQVRKDLGRAYANDEDYFNRYDEENDLWLHENQAYNLTLLDQVIIEAQPGTVFYLNNTEEKVVGSTGLYAINTNIRSIKFKQTTYAIVTFKTIATIRELKGADDNV